jgi:glucose/arabinose dehydrogenase
MKLFITPATIRNFGYRFVPIAFSILWLTSCLHADEADYYRITKMQTPEDEVLEASGFQLMPDGRMAVSTRRGDIWMIDSPHAETIPAASFHLYARGLHEPLSMSFRDGWLYVTQRPEVTRVRDTDGDLVADEFETVADGWGISGDYHEYAFASKFDKDDNLWVVLCLTGSFSSKVAYRGWCLRVGVDGTVTPTASGIRSPGGVGANAEGDIFYTDNQGPWNGTCGLKHLTPGKFMGHPGGFQWYKLAESVLGQKPEEPKSDSRIMTEAARIPELEPTVVMFPYGKMGQSASGVTCDTTGGKFGPFIGQLFVADQTQSTVMRVFLEKVDGHYQGACFPFRKGFSSGNVGLELTPQGSMFVGGTNRGWGSSGSEPFALERLDWTGKVPMEILEMHAKPDGFELVFTQAVNRETAKQRENYKLSSYTYLYRSDYGSPEVDHREPGIKSVQVSDDGMSVRIVSGEMNIGHVHELSLSNVTSEQGDPVLHPVAYYTLNYLPK